MELEAASLVCLRLFTSESGTTSLSLADSGNPALGRNRCSGYAPATRNLMPREDRMSRFTQSLLSLALLVGCVVLTGCVHRRVTISSSPPGALVKVDGRDIGYTPASLDFTWYGTREVQLLMDGYETHTELVDIKAPWFQRFPLDFLSDNFLGRHTTDHRQFSFQLRPRRLDVPGDLMNRAGSLRSEALHGR